MNEYKGKKTEGFNNHLKKLYFEDNETEKQKEQLKSIDELLDTYNDYIELYEKFEDEKYKEKANGVMKRLKAGEYV